MEMEERLLKVLSKFGYVNNHIEDLKLYEDLGLDSLKRTELICEIENEFGFEFELDELNPESFSRTNPRNLIRRCLLIQY